MTCGCQHYFGVVTFGVCGMILMKTVCCLLIHRIDDIHTNQLRELFLFNSIMRREIVLFLWEDEAIWSKWQIMEI